MFFVDFLVIAGVWMVGSPVYGGFGDKVVCQMVPEVGFDAARLCQEVVLGVPNAARKVWRLFFEEVICLRGMIELMSHFCHGINFE